MLTVTAKSVFMYRAIIMTQRWRFIVYLLVSIAVIMLDQWSKVIADAQLQYGQPVTVLPVFNWLLQYNYGAAFSFLSDAGGWQRWFFVVVSAGVSAGLLVWIYRLKNQQTLLAIALVFILGGALGNLWDRLILGYVIDFISLHWNEYYFPAFNVADAAISLGVGLMLLDMIIHPENHRDDSIKPS